MDFAIKVLEREISSQKFSVKYHSHMILIGCNLRAHNEFMDECQAKIKSLEIAIEKLKKETTDGLCNTNIE